MKTFRVRETYEVAGWAIFKAEDEEMAIKLLERGLVGVADFDDVRAKWKCEDTDWDSLEEVKG